MYRAGREMCSRMWAILHVRRTIAKFHADAEAVKMPSGDFFRLGYTVETVNKMPEDLLSLRRAFRRRKW